MLTNHRCLAYDHTCTMVDAKMRSNTCPWMNINTCSGVGKFCNDPWHHWNVELVKFVGNSVHGNGIKSWIGSDHLKFISCGRVSLNNSGDVGEQLSMYLR